MAAMPVERVSSKGRRTGTPSDDPKWPLALRGPIVAYDEHTDDEVQLEIGQRNPDRIEGLLIDFRYVSADGELSRRSVLCWQCGRHGSRLYIRGYCAFREELRTFRVDRMSDVIALQGERQRPVEDIVGFFAAFAARETHEGSSVRLQAPD